MALFPGLVRHVDSRPPLLVVLGAALKGEPFTEPLPFDSFQPLAWAMLPSASKGPVEEFGWRGLALPLPQRRFAPFWAGLILGGDLGSLASARLFPERNAAKRLAIRTLPDQPNRGQRDADALVQRLTRQPPASRPVPFPAQRSAMAGCPA